MKIAKEIFDVPHNGCPTVFSPDYPPIWPNKDGTFSLRREHLIPTKLRGSGDTTHADNLWLNKSNHWNTMEYRVTFPTEESAQAHWEQFCEANSA